MNDGDFVDPLDDTKRSLSESLTLCRKIIDHYRSTLVHYIKADGGRPNSIFGRVPDAGEAREIGAAPTIAADPGAEKR